MATVPRAVPVAPLPNVSANRTVGATRVASSAGGVDELQTSFGVSFDTAEFRFHDDDHAFFERGNNRSSRQHQTGLFTAPTQAFAALFENGGSNRQDDNAPGDIKTPRFAGLVSKAIAIYETNARIISGENNILGTSISMVL